jgi:hypothetical protein
MDVNWQILSNLGTEIQGAKDTQEVTEIWHRFLNHLRDDCKLIYSDPGESDVVMPSKKWPRNFAKGGFLRALFAYDNLYFLNRRIAEDQILKRESPLKIDITVEFDTNVASYVESFTDNSSTNRRQMVKDLIDFVITTKEINFGYNFYALENAQGFFDGSQVQSIRRNLKAILKLDYLDRGRYQKSGELRLNITDEELGVKTDEKLHELYSPPYRDGLEREFIPINEMLYVLLLKIVEIKYSDKRKLNVKMEELYQFMHFELKTLLVREAIIALHYLKNRSKLIFFGKINPKRKEKRQELFKELRGMSWDLMLFRVMEKIATLPGEGDFLIPYFLSFDKKMVQLFDLFPLKGILASQEGTQMLPLWVTPPLDELQQEIKIEKIRDYFSNIASNVRFIERLADTRPDLGNLKTHLEEKITRLLTY